MSYTYVFFLGNHPLLSLSEAWGQLERHAYTPHLISFDDQYAVIATSRELLLSHWHLLGGSNRVAQVLGQQPDPWTAEAVLAQLAPLPPKLTIGVSAVGLSADFLKPLAKELKQAAKSQGTKLTFILPTGRRTQLNSAQVLFNHLTDAPNQELTFIAAEDDILLTRTVASQDIAAYERRDTQRPARDTRVGLLPPKVAQMMLAFASQAFPADQPLTILDPFCGMGTILQEGWLQGHVMTGTDNSEAMITASEQNMAWLAQQFTGAVTLPELRLHDVRRPFPSEWQQSFDAVVTEPYLGAPLRHALSREEVAQHQAPLEELYLSFFASIQPVLKSGGRVIAALPAFHVRSRRGKRFAFLSDRFLDAVIRLGYSRSQLIPPALSAAGEVPQERLSALYARADAHVGREMTVWEKV